jgi:hypothetical protein
MKTQVRKVIAGALIVAMGSSGVMPEAWAGTIGTESALASDRERILVAFDRPDVRSALEARGVSADEAKARIAALTDAEAAQLARQIDSAPAGAGGNPAGIVLLPIYALVGVIRLVGLVLSLVFGAH